MNLPVKIRRDESITLRKYIPGENRETSMEFPVRFRFEYTRSPVSP
jgi:hypothetical protein